MTVLHSIILAIVEGITEFLPVSSTAHLIITSTLLGLKQTEFIQFFEIFIQIGAILAVTTLYFKTLWKNKRLWGLLIASFVPTGIIGLIAHKYLKDILFNSLFTIASALILVGALFLVVEWLIKHKKLSLKKTIKSLTYKDAILIGLIQALAVIPGVSRSGAIILGMLFLGYKRKDSIVYSFLLGLPTLSAAAFLDFYKTKAWLLPQDSIMLVLLATVFSFVFAVISIKWLIRYIQTHTLNIFGIYRIVLGTLILLALLVPIFSFSSGSGLVEVKYDETVTKERSNLILYVGQGCKHCAKVEKFINENGIIPEIVIKEVYYNKNNAKELAEVFLEFNVSAGDQGVPFLIDTQNKKYFSGDKAIIAYLDQSLLNNKPSVQVSGPGEEINGQCVVGEIDEGGGFACGKTEEVSKQDSSETKIEKSNSSVQKNPLTVWAVVSAALVDAINPCAFAVLLTLLATISLHAKNEKKSRKKVFNIIVSGFAFAGSIFVSYLLMGIGVYHALATVKTVTIFTKILASGAIIVGLLNLKDAIWYGKGGFVMEVPRSWRPKMIAIIKKATGPVGSALVGLAVSLFLLPCTSGPYIIILGMLQSFSIKALGWLVLYNLIFVSPMFILTLGVAKGANIVTLQEKRQESIKLLHLIAGVIMVVLGVWLLVGGG